MKILIIDSHKGSNKLSNNLHLLNAKAISDYLGADLIWSYIGVNDHIKSGYDAIIFSHASHYSFVDYAWLESNPNAKLFYITNEYNLGEPRILWMAAKRGRKYDVIANHSHEPSKVVMKYVENWNILNLNSLVYCPVKNDVSSKKDIIYYGSYRADRSTYFSKYIDENVILSTHPKNVNKFKSSGANPKQIIKRIKWDSIGLSEFLASLYIEDIKTHTHYNHLANRFYESLNYNVVPLFGKECLNTIVKSGYKIPNQFIIDNNIQEIYNFILNNEDFVDTFFIECNKIASKERQDCLISIKNLVT